MSLNAPTVVEQSSMQDSFLFCQHCFGSGQVEKVDVDLNLEDSYKMELEIDVEKSLPSGNGGRFSN